MVSCGMNNRRTKPRWSYASSSLSFSCDDDDASSLTFYRHHRMPMMMMSDIVDWLDAFRCVLPIFEHPIDYRCDIVLRPSSILPTPNIVISFFSPPYGIADRPSFRRDDACLCRPFVDSSSSHCRQHHRYLRPRHVDSDSSSSAPHYSVDAFFAFSIGIASTAFARKHVAY